MNKNTKKIIAREFLFLLGTTILFVCVVFTWLILSESNHDREIELQNEIQTLTKIERIPYRLRIFYLINNEIIVSPKEKMTDRENFISNLKDKEQASIIYNGLKEYRCIENTKDEFFEEITKDIESENYLNNLLLSENELEKTKASFFNSRKSSNKILSFGTLLFLVFFVFRYLIYGTRWSIKQMKE